jgi:hypothetical protein
LSLSKRASYRDIFYTLLRHGTKHVDSFKVSEFRLRCSLCVQEESSPTCILVQQARALFVQLVDFQVFCCLGLAVRPPPAPFATTVTTVHHRLGYCHHLDCYLVPRPPRLSRPPPRAPSPPRRDRHHHPMQNYVTPPPLGGCCSGPFGHRHHQ